MDISKAIRGRRSVRKFLDKPVELFFFGFGQRTPVTGYDCERGYPSPDGLPQTPVERQQRGENDKTECEIEGEQQ